MAKPRAQPNYDLRWTPFTASEEFQEFYIYNKQDVRAELEVCSRIPDMSPKEHRVWLMHMRCNQRGMHVNVPAVIDCIEIMEQAFGKYTARLRTITGDKVCTASEVQEIIKWLGATYDMRLYDLDEETVEEWLARKDIPDGAREVLRIRQVLAFGSVKKLYAFLHQTGWDHRLRDQYVFFGAHTGLWNGRGVQPANLYSGSFHKPEQVAQALAVIAFRSLELVEATYAPMDALDVVASCLRSLIIARPGSRLMGSDFSAIQAVVLAALAGEEWRLEVFRTHGKIYEMSASKISGVPFDEIMSYKDPATGQPAKHPLRQTIGKVAELASGFMGWVGAWKRFGADEFMGSDEEIKQAILKWRRESPMVVELAGGQTRNKFNRDPQGNFVRGSERPELFGLEGAAISAVMNPGQCFKYRQCAYQMHEDALYYCGPSGTFMTYHSPRLEPSCREWASPWEQELSYMGWDTKAGWSRDKLYAGVLAQNADSHESREIQAEKLARLEDTGVYLPVMHTHDEDVCEVENGRGVLAEYLAETRVMPDWARTPDGKPWPIKVPDAWEGPAYGKWELKGNEPGYKVAT